MSLGEAANLAGAVTVQIIVLLIICGIAIHESPPPDHPSR